MHIGFLPVNRRMGRFPPRSAASGLAAVSFLYLIFEAPDGADIAYFRGGRFFSVAAVSVKAGRVIRDADGRRIGGVEGVRDDQVLVVTETKMVRVPVLQKAPSHPACRRV